MPVVVGLIAAMSVAGTVACQAASRTPARGAVLWTARYNGPGNGADNALAALVVTPDGRTVVVAGTGRSGTKPFRCATVGYDAGTGARQWARSYGEIRRSDSATALAVSPTGKTVYLTGTTTSPESFLAVAYDAATGARAWARDSEPSPAPAEVTGAAVGRSGTLYVIGDVGYGWFATVAYSPAGRRIWTSRFGRRNSMTPVWSDVVSPVSGEVYVTGYTGGQSARTDNYLTIASRG
ncbi:MAG: PQQ-binding-like beta-propeller repeat protein [Streptosporangiaceae bacterium]